MNIFVTGGAGYVGSHCVRELCAGGHSVVVYDNLRHGHTKAVDSRATLVVGDLGNSVRLREALSGRPFDAVMHFAAFLDVGESVREPLAYYRNNVSCTIALLELMRELGIKRFVFSSSCAVYGIPARMPITEDMPQLPINPYGRTKLMMEWAMRDSAAAWGLGGTALRYFNAAGAATEGTLGEDHRPEIHVIPLALQTALGQRERIEIFGEDYPTYDGTCIRDYVHVEDLARAHRLAVETQEFGEFRAYNVGTGRGVSVKEVIDAAREVTGKKIAAVVGPRRPGDPPELFADARRIENELGWKAVYTDIRRTIETAWQWHRAHPNGYADR